MNKKSKNNIPYNIPTLTGREELYLNQVMQNGVFSGKNYFNEKCLHFFDEQYGFKHSFLTPSCSLALEMAANLCELSSDDEVIVPSYAYITDASAFAKTGAQLIFADSKPDSPHISVESIRKKLSPRTKVLLLVHYAGISCDMEKIMELVKENNLILVEDCAQAIHARYKGQYLGSFGQLSTFSFHETKNIQAGEGGLLVVNESSLVKMARQMWNEGSNREEFTEAKASHYEWTSLGSSYQVSELSAAFLLAQLEEVEAISLRRKEKWNYYYTHLQSLSNQVYLPYPELEDFNAHIFYLKLKDKKQRLALQDYMAANQILAPFHYQALHLSQYWLKRHKKVSLTNAENWADCLLRLPLFDSISKSDQDLVIKSSINFFNTPN